MRSVFIGFIRKLVLRLFWDSPLSFQCIGLSSVFTYFLKIGIFRAALLRGLSLFISMGGYDFTRGVIIFYSPFNRGVHLFSFNGSTKCKKRPVYPMIQNFFALRARGRHFFLHSVGGGVVFFFSNFQKKI